MALTVHGRTQPRVLCHTCDYRAPLPAACPSCKCRELTEQGAGTERIEAALAGYFHRKGRAPRSRCRVGRQSETIWTECDVARSICRGGRKWLPRAMTCPMSRWFACWTQIDGVASMPDYRAAERAFQLLVQVAGRAGSLWAIGARRCADASTGLA